AAEAKAPNLSELADKRNAIFQKKTMEARKQVFANEYQAFAKRADKNVKQAVDAFKRSNDEFMHRYNTEMVGLKGSAKEVSDQVQASGKGLVGLGWHIDDIFETKDFKEVENIFN